MTSAAFRPLPWLAILSLAACSVPPIPAPVPPAPLPAAPASSPPAPLSADWRDWPTATGNWSYATLPGGSAASFAAVGGQAELRVRCDLAARQVVIARRGAAGAGEMRLHTSFGTVRWPVTSAIEQGVAVSLALRTASDGALDQLASTRGRFAIEAPGAASLSFPLWAEVARVIEDCRG